MRNLLGCCQVSFADKDKFGAIDMGLHEWSKYRIKFLEAQWVDNCDRTDSLQVIAAISLNGIEYRFRQAHSWLNGLNENPLIFIFFRHENVFTLYFIYLIKVNIYQET